MIPFNQNALSSLYNTVKHRSSKVRFMILLGKKQMIKSSLYDIVGKNPDVLSSLYDSVGKIPRCFKFAL